MKFTSGFESLIQSSEPWTVDPAFLGLSEEHGLWRATTCLICVESFLILSSLWGESLGICRAAWWLHFKILVVRTTGQVALCHFGLLLQRDVSCLVHLLTAFDYKVVLHGSEIQHCLLLVHSFTALDLLLRERDGCCFRLAQNLWRWIWLECRQNRMRLLRLVAGCEVAHVRRMQLLRAVRLR